MATTLDEAIRQIAAKIHARRNGGRILNEDNTKAELIEPMLRALGWDTANSEVVDRECKNDYPRGCPVDYSLRIHREPKLLVEAKGIGVAVGDR